MIEPQFIHDPHQRLACCFDGDHLRQKGLGSSPYGTVVRLPFDKKALEQVDRIRMKLQEAFDDKLLLFLRRLSSMQLNDNVDETQTRHTRETMLYGESDQGESSWNWTKIKTDKREEDGKQRTVESLWYVKTVKFRPAEKRANVDVDSTEVSIAIRFQLTAEQRDSKSNEHDVTEGIEATEGTKINIALDTTSYLYPIYAYLPTKTAAFQFVLQGDFILPANREALKEDDPWNRHLMERVPDLYVDMIVQIASTIRSATTPTPTPPTPTPIASSVELGVEAISAEDPLLLLLPLPLPLPSVDHKIHLSAKDLISLLPNLSGTEGTKSMYNILRDRIYSKLSDRPILKSISGAYCAPSKLVALNSLSLSFDPTQFISEDVLYGCTGKRYMDNDLALDPGTLKALRIDYFDCDTVFKCIEMKLSNGSLSVKDLSGMLLALHRLSGAQSSSSSSSSLLSSASTSKPAMIPPQLYSRSLRNGAVQRINQGTGDGCKKLKETCEKLKKLPIWPLERKLGMGSGSGSKGDLGPKVSLEFQPVFMHGLNSTLSFKERKCFDLLPHDLVTLLDDELFTWAKETVPDGDKILKKWLLEKFSPNDIGAFGKKLDGGKGGGGLVELSLKGIVISAILPKYASISPDVYESQVEGACDSGGADGGEESYLTRHGFNRTTACACLAFIYLSGVPMDPAAKCSAIVPLLSAKSNAADDLIWTLPSLQSGRQTACRDADMAKKGTRREVHLGVEFEDSATSRLGVLKMKTAMRQVLKSDILHMIQTLMTS